MWLKRTALLLAGLLVLVIGLGWASQRKYVYLIDPTYRTPAQAGLAAVDEVRLATPDGERLVAWWGKAAPGRPTILYFHGNGANLARRAERIRTLMAAGLGVFILAYRGYSGSTGLPSERRNVADATLAYDWLRQAGTPASRMVLYGESLGTGVATELAEHRPAAGLVLDSPFTSITDMAWLRFPGLPASLFLTERYNTIDHIGSVHMPLLIVHGEADRVVPVTMGRAVFQAANQPKQIATFAGAGHANHPSYGSYRTVIDFVDGLDAARSVVQPVQ